MNIDTHRANRFCQRLSIVGPLMLSAAVWLAEPCQLSASAQESASSGSPYHADPQHLWNRLHEALFVRTGPDGREYGRDRLEPLLWNETTHLAKAKSHDRAVALLQEFLDQHGENLFVEPVKHAVLQRDMWLIFNWLQLSRNNDVRLANLLATAIGRVALTSEEIETIPDNYADAIESNQFPRRFDPDRPDEPYLPSDLFADDGPWLCLGRPDSPVAPQHLRDDGGNPSTNSVFLVFLRMPGGRPVVAEFLNKLRSFDEPLVVMADDSGTSRRNYIPNPALPSFPVGTEMALVRQAILINSSHNLVATSLTESVQLRIYREIPEMTKQQLDASLTGGTAANRRTEQWQSFYEFRMSRPLLFEGHKGLRAIAADERDFKTGFRAHGWDPFENRETEQAFRNGTLLPIRQTCFACHSLPGITSFNSYTDDWRGAFSTGKMRPPASLSITRIAEVRSSSVEWKTKHPGSLLRAIQSRSE